MIPFSRGQLHLQLPFLCRGGYSWIRVGPYDESADRYNPSWVREIGEKLRAAVVLFGGRFQF